jgi:hypothetical protein
MTVDDLIKQLESLKPELRKKEVKVLAENGELVTPEIKTILKEPHNIWDKSDDNVSGIYLGVN